MEKQGELRKTEEVKAENVIEARYKIVPDDWHIVPVDAPNKHALEMAKTLMELDADAIFFVNGHFLESEDKRTFYEKFIAWALQLAIIHIAMQSYQTYQNVNKRKK